MINRARLNDLINNLTSSSTASLDFPVSVEMSLAIARGVRPSRSSNSIHFACAFNRQYDGALVPLNSMRSSPLVRATTLLPNSIRDFLAFTSCPPCPHASQRSCPLLEATALPSQHYVLRSAMDRAPMESRAPRGGHRCE